jgi:hypothetical protein
MKLLKSEIKYLSQIVFVWTFINLILNLAGIFITKLLNKTEYAYLEDVTNEFIKPLAIQFLLFGICLLVGFVLLKNKKIAHYTFAAFQFLVFHVIFLLNLNFKNGGHFETTFSNYGLKYLSYTGQYLVDILYLYFPINGNFENNLFMPSNTGTFYIHWILLNLVYYVAITWLSIKVTKLIFKSNCGIQKPTESQS